MLRQTALLVAAVLGVPGVTSCSTDSGTEGSGTEASSVRKVPSINSVEVRGQADAVVTVRQARKVTVRGDDNLLEHVETKVNGDHRTRTSTRRLASRSTSARRRSTWSPSAGSET
jgi:hypothetical protein